MEGQESDPSSTERTERIRQFGHELYQRLYGQIAEGVEVSDQAVLTQLVADLSVDDKLDIIQQALHEAEYRRLDEPRNAPDEHKESVARINENVYLTLSQARLELQNELEG